ncbi:MAG: addiction module protein [Thermodesulfobacteriota bacterium]
MNIQDLSVSERILLAQELWESVAEQATEIPLSHAQAAVLEERLRALASDENPGEPWDVVKKRILGA